MSQKNKELIDYEIQETVSKSGMRPVKTKGASRVKESQMGRNQGSKDERICNRNIMNCMQNSLH